MDTSYTILASHMRILLLICPRMIYTVEMAFLTAQNAADLYIKFVSSEAIFQALP